MRMVKNNTRGIIQLLASGQLGGGEMVAIDLADSLSGAFAGMRVWTPSTGAALDEVRRRNIGATSIPYLRILTERSMARLRAFTHSMCAMARYRPLLIHAHSPYAYRAISLFQRAFRFRSIVHIHLDTEPKTLSWCFKNPPDMVVACAEYLVPSIQTALNAVGADQTKIIVCRNSVDIKRFIPGDRMRTRQELGFPTDSIILMMLANLSPHKGQETTIQVVRLLRERGLPAEAYLAGVDREQTNYEEALKQMAHRSGVADAIHFLGFRRDTERLLQAADFFLLPSTHEGLPLSILEAQSARVPVLAAPTAGVPEVVEHEKTGYLIPANNAEGYALTIERMLSSPSHAHRVIDRAQEMVLTECSRATYVQSISDLYHGLIRQG
jgi:glycosyltransferase involved in cell wall biosynthesis